MNEMAHHITVVGHRIQGLRGLVEDLSRRDYPSGSPLILNEIVGRVLARLFDQLPRISSEIGTRSNQDILGDLQAINHAAITLGRLLEAVNSARVTKPISSVIEALDVTAERISTGTRTLIYPQWNYNATYVDVMEFLRGWAALISPIVDEGIFQGLPRHFLRITYPAVEEKNILRQAILSHELGHFTDTSRKLSEGLMTEKLFDPDLGNRLISAATSSNASAAVSLALDTIENWVRELVADSIGAAILGPAYLMAFDDVVRMPHNPAARGSSTSHPPHALRVRLMAKLVEDMHIRELQSRRKRLSMNRHQRSAFDKLVDVIQSFQQSSVPSPWIAHSKLSKEEGEIAFLLGEKALESATVKLSLKIEALAKEGWFCTSKDVMTALICQELLELGLPPSELPGKFGSFPTFPSIMNSGWIYLAANEDNYSFFNDAGSPIGDPREIGMRYIRLQNLIAKALEISMARAEFMRRKGSEEAGG